MSANMINEWNPKDSLVSDYKVLIIKEDGKPWTAIVKNLGKKYWTGQFEEVGCIDGLYSDEGDGRQAEIKIDKNTRLLITWVGVKNIYEGNIYKNGKMSATYPIYAAQCGFE